MSSNHSYTLALQPDGNLVLYDLGGGGQRALWNTHTAGNGDVKNLVMQGDCNLVMYGNSGKAIWNSHTSRGSQFCTLVVQDDGNLVIYDGAHNAVWNTNTMQH